MFKKTKIDNQATSTVIGDGITIEGARITGTGVMRIDGEVIGELDVVGNIIIGETGHVVGNINVNHLLIAGRMEGNAICRETIHLEPTSQLIGNIEAASLVVDEGAVFNGMSSMNTNYKNNERRNPKQKDMTEPYQEISDAG